MFYVLLKSKPAATTQSLENLVMWISDKPVDWLYSLPEEECAMYYEESRKVERRFRVMMKTRGRKY